MLEEDIFTKFSEFFDLYKSEIHEGKTSIIIDFKKIIEFDSELADGILEMPTTAIKLAEEYLMSTGKSLNVRFTNLPEIDKISIRSIRVKDLNKLISLTGLIRQSSDVRPQLLSVAFCCPSCGTKIHVLQDEQKVKRPTACSCGHTNYFDLVEKAFIDTQRLVVEEATEDLDGDSQPKRISVILKGDLVEPSQMRKTIPGNRVKIVGIVREVPKKVTIYDIVVEANNIELLDEDYSKLTVTDEDIKKIIEFSKQTNSFELLRSSIAPSIFGLDEVKEALLIQLFGGVRKIRKDNTIFRNVIHLLLIGEPGVAKSSLMSFIHKSGIAPKVRYITGKTTTTAGVVASVVKDDASSNWVLEAGAVVLAHKGILLIDEVDKMEKDDVGALHEVMEQCSVTVAKANIQASLKAETAITMAANPKFGRFDMYQSISDQLNLPPALINRFDLIFPLRDIPNEKRDEDIAKHILNFSNQDIKIDALFLRKYITYAKQNIIPTITSEAENAITKYYVGLRNSYNRESKQAIPISPRQLEALVRLSEGSAKARLSNKVELQDALRAIRLLEYCLKQVGVDFKTGELDIDLITTGIAASKRSLFDNILRLLHKLEDSGSKVIPMDELLAKTRELNLEDYDVEEAIEKLKKSGDIYSPKHGCISLV